MSPLPDDRQPISLEPDEAYQRALQMLDPIRPDYEAAQMFAILALRESVEKLAAEVQQASRRR